MSTSLAFDRTRVLRFPAGSYERVWRRQQQLREERIRRQTPDLILVGEHERVITVGRGLREPLPALPIPVHEIERGGEATWHGPGQLVGYPILHLGDLGLGVRDYLTGLVDALCAALAGYGLPAEGREGATGVWVEGRKVASLGVAVRRHVTLHGFALNVRADLSDFGLIRPCGFDAQVMVSLDQLLGEATPDSATVEQDVLLQLIRRFELAPPIWEPWEG